MTLPVSIRTGLAEVWPFDEGSGTVAHGMMELFDLTLSGSRGAGTNGVDGCWVVGSPGFTGGGFSLLPASLKLAAVGDAVTYAMEMWYGGGALTLDAWTGGGEGITALELSDAFSPNLSVNWGVAVPPPLDPSTNTHIYYGVGVGSGNGVDTFINAPPFAGTGAYVLLIECVRVSGTDVRVRLYQRNAQVQNTETTSWGVPLNDVAISGKYHAVRRAAVWGRVLTSDERAGLFDGGDGTLDGLVEMVEGGDPTSGIDLDGNPVLVPDFPVVRPDQTLVLASDGGHRHTRLVAERQPRRYEVRFSQMEPAEADRLRTIIAAARGGAGEFQWRHAIDDAPGSADSAPWWRVMSDSIDLKRNKGGQSAGVDFILETVE
jgi:hypothetical protein